MKNPKMHKCGAYPFAKYCVVFGVEHPLVEKVFGDARGSDGMTAMIENIVVVYISSAGDHARTLSTLVHESVHVWQMIRSAAGEEGHSTEAEAYGIQQIFENLRKDLVKIVEKEEADSLIAQEVAGDIVYDAIQKPINNNYMSPVDQ
jgi:hypothetical protein